MKPPPAKNEQTTASYDPHNVWWIHLLMKGKSQCEDWLSNHIMPLKNWNGNIFPSHIKIIGKTWDFEEINGRTSTGDPSCSFYFLISMSRISDHGVHPELKEWSCQKMSFRFYYYVGSPTHNQT